MVEIELAGPPMGKERVRVTRGGHAYTPQRTVHYEARLAWAAQQAMCGRDPLTGPLKVEMDVLMPIPKSKPKRWKAAAADGSERPTKKPDGDNFAKMMDALNMIAWIDDSQVVDLRVRKFYSERPAMRVRIHQIGET